MEHRARRLSVGESQHACIRSCENLPVDMLIEIENENGNCYLKVNFGSHEFCPFVIYSDGTRCQIVDDWQTAKFISDKAGFPMGAGFVIPVPRASSQRRIEFRSRSPKETVVAIQTIHVVGVA